MKARGKAGKTSEAEREVQITLFGDYTFRAACLFGGGGGMALGTQQADSRFRAHEARYELCGAYDFDPYACQVYEYLTGCKQAQLDAMTITPGDVYRLFDGKVPDTVWCSAPCKGSSKLLASSKAKTPKYEKMNTLSYRGIKMLLDAFPGDEPAFIVLENVPNITTRAKDMLKDLFALFEERGLLVHSGFHEARAIGDLAQRRKRWFCVVRNPRKVPVLLYRPPRKAGKVCGDVLGPLPLPNDPAGGPMHRLSDTSMINLLRLWAIPAGGDWRDLINDGRPRRERFRRHHLEKWTEPSVTIGGSGSNGPCGIADPRTGTFVGVELARSHGGFTSLDHVLRWDSASRTITCATRPGSGAPSIADPRFVPINLLGGQAPTEGELRDWERNGLRADGATLWMKGKYGVSVWGLPTRTVIGGAQNGAAYVADPRLDLSLPLGTFHHVNRVTAWDDATGTVTHSPAPSSGAPSVADPRPINLLEGTQLTWYGGAYGVSAPWLVGATVTGAASPANGRFSYADPRLSLVDGTEPWRDEILGVVTDADVIGTVTSRAGATTGRFSYAAPAPQPVDLRPQAGNDNLHWGKYTVVPWDDATKTVTCASRIGSGAASIADPRIELATGAGGTFHAGSGPGRWGVLTPFDPASTVTGNARLHTGPFSFAARPPISGFAPVDLSVSGVWRNRYGVLSPLEEASTITGNARLHTGPFSFAAPAPRPIDLVPTEPCYDAGYGVLRYDQPSRTIATACAVGCGAYAIADGVPGPALDLSLGCTPRADAYGVQAFQRESATVTASFKVDNSRAAVADPREAPSYVVLSYEETKCIVDGVVQIPFAVVDPAHPEEPLAIVDSLKRAPFRWVEHVTERVTKRGKVSRRVTRVRETVALVLISEDGTWHRPLTTLELAILQAFPAEHKGKALDLGVPAGSRGRGPKADQAVTAQREVIGNAVPPAVARAMAEQMLLSLTVANGAVASMGDFGTPVWVKNVLALERQLQAEGYVVAKAGVTMNFTTGEQLDDGALVWGNRAKATKPKGTKQAAKRRAVRHTAIASRTQEARVDLQ